ncbi:MAG: hypothetical protein M1832_004907 [Thelocarpon impressellum]|nr:MAG: hypothetical protein M1832_004907 [Thelocarpon impressellum]
MVSRKRGRREMEAVAEASPPPAVDEQPGTLDRLRNMWEFANLAQYLFTFGKAVNLEQDVDIEDLETECLKPDPSARLAEVGLALLKFVSSHRGLTPELFDEYTRRQYVARAPTRNPFGEDETPASFSDFDVATKIRVLWQLSQWTMIHCERIRGKMPEQKDSEQVEWRVEPVGWDARECTYFVLDDNRLYRQTEAPPPPSQSKPKKNSKKAKAAARASKRRKLSAGAEDDDVGEKAEPTEQEQNLLGGRKWECVAITLDQYKDFTESIRRSRNLDEKALYQQVTEHILPVVEKAEESLRRKAEKKHREVLNLEKLATAKRSSRIAGKMEKQKEEEEAVEAERTRKAELEAAMTEQETRRKMEQERETRIMTREQRVKEREMRRILHEEELANLSEDSKKLDVGQGRMSGRHLKAEMEKRKKALEELAQEDDWIFDCSGCGVHGENLDDGTGIVACEKCSVWQHLACLGLRRDAAEQEDFHFVCALCKRRETDREKSAKNPIKLDFRKLGSSASPPSDKSKAQVVVQVNGHGKREGSPDHLGSPPSKRKRLEVAHQDGSGPSNATPALPTDGVGIAPSSPFPRSAVPLSGVDTSSKIGGGHLNGGSARRSGHGDTPAAGSTLDSASPVPFIHENGLVEAGHTPTTGDGGPHGQVGLPTLPRNSVAAYYDDHARAQEVERHDGNGADDGSSRSPAQGNKGGRPQPAAPSPNGTFAPPRQTDSLGHSPTKMKQVGVSSSPQRMSDVDIHVSGSAGLGLSPTKSTPSRPGQALGTTPAGHHSTPAPVLPPAPSLSPSPRQLDLTPPSKTLPAVRRDGSGDSHEQRLAGE